MTESQRKRQRPHIKNVGGVWYAYPGSGMKKSVNLLLVPAISFCKRLNQRSS